MSDDRELWETVEIMQQCADLLQEAADNPRDFFPDDDGSVTALVDGEEMVFENEADLSDFIGDGWEYG